MTRPLAAAALIVPAAVFAGVYGLAAGHGLIKDDYAWILNSRVASVTDLVALFRQDNGFYRPVVALTFAMNAALSGASPRGYGLVNVALALVAAWMLARLAWALGLPRASGALAAAVFLLNPHLRVPVLWVSGRTALVLTIAALGSAAALVRGRVLVAWTWLIVALFAKEEAVLLPVILTAWLYVLTSDGDVKRVRPAVWAAGVAAALAVYAAARLSTSAMTPWSAPPFYRFTFDPAAILANVVAYADRSLSLAGLVTILSLAVLGRPRPFLDDRTRRLALCAAIWIAGGFGLTVFLPIRSDVYACLPSAGGALLAAAVITRAWRHARPPRRTAALAGAVVLALALAPVLHSRTRRFVEPGRFTTDVMRDLQALTADLPDGAAVIVHDDRSRRVNLDATFGTLFNDAFRVSSGRRLNLWVEPPPADARWAGLERPCDTCVLRELRVVDGRLVR